jgi:SAM-dependent methyltransferase
MTPERQENYNQQIYRQRWTDAELASVGKVWETLTRHFFQKITGDNARVLDIGCGFCHFLNHLKAKEKVGIDDNPQVKNYAASDVTIIQSDDLSLNMLTREHFDCVFISNFLEHLDNTRQATDLLHRIKELLKPGGKIIILQPNFRLLGPAYFDFIDHRTILTDRSLEEMLNITGFEIEKKIVRFLPYSTKSNIPRSPFLIRLYLAFRPAWFIMGKQSLFVAVKREEAREKPGA